MAPKRSMVSGLLDDECLETDDDDSTYVETIIVSDSDSSHGLEMGFGNGWYVNSSDCDDMNNVLYKNYLKELMHLEKIKSKLSKSLKLKAKNMSQAKKPKEAFTRFSVSYFSSVIDALSSDRKEIIGKYGLGSLLKFQRCVVPNKFAQWVAHHIDYKSGDIVLKPKIIPLTSEIVSLVLDLPRGDLPFSRDNSAGKSALLARFNLVSMPSIRFFGDKLLNKIKMSDEDVVVCFLVVALNCFLCPNSSLYPSAKYLGIFEDIFIVPKLDLCQLVLDWLLEAIKSYNVSKKSGKEKQTLGGYLYLICVYYLDCVDFGHRQVPAGIPRILFWKDNMIKSYSDLDQVKHGSYGFRPLLDIANTCYSKQSVYLYKKPSSLTQNSDFMDKLESCSGCHLPLRLKTGICSLIAQHCLNSTLSVNLDVTSLASLSDELKKTFSTLLEHAYSVDSRTQSLVLKILKLVSEFCNDDDDDEGVQKNSSNSNGEDIPDLPHHVAAHDENQNNKSSDDAFHSPCHDPIKGILLILLKGHHKMWLLIHVFQIRSKASLLENYETKSDIGRLRDPLCDIDQNIGQFATLKRSVNFVRENGERDVISLEKENQCTSEFFSPYAGGDASRYVFRKRKYVDAVEPSCSE
ncbi:hypothetical protein ACP4OV_030421 [Aristida adscensionis]